MFRPLLTVALPDDWVGKLARLGVGLFTFVWVLWVLLGTMPAGWMTLARGNEWLARAVVFVVVITVISRLRNVVYALLPRAPVVWFGRLTYRGRGKRETVRLDELAEVHVDLRPEPSGEVFVVEFLDGSEIDLCPVHWDGAEHVYSRLARALRRSERRRRREAARARRSAGQGSATQTGTIGNTVPPT